MNGQITELIERSSNIAVLCHINSDGDALGSAFALTRFLKKRGKSVQCFLEERPGRDLEFMGDDYKVYCGEDEGSYDLCIAVDCGDKSRLGARAALFQNADATVNIDHHKTNTGFADINLVKPDYSATSQIIAELMFGSGYELDSEIARLLYIGIMSDSGCLKFSNTTPKTVRTVADLMGYGFDHSETARLLFDSCSLEYTMLKGYIMQNVESYADGMIRLVQSTSALLEKFGISDADASNLVNVPRSIEKTEIAIEVKERSGKIKVSLRSNGAAEVDRIASRFGGGGHLRAAGATLEGYTLKDAKEAVLNAAFDELRRIQG